MPCAAGELCLNPDHTPVDPDGHQCRGRCGGRLHGCCGDVEGEHEIHRICPACVSSKQASTAAAGKRKAQGAGSIPKRTTDRRTEVRRARGCLWTRRWSCSQTWTGGSLRRWWRRSSTAPCVLVSPTNHRRRLHPTRNATSYYVPLLRTQPLCHRHPPCWLYIPHAVLYPSDIVNSAPSRTIQARNHIVRVPAIVRVLWFGTYPHYRGHPTVKVYYSSEASF